MLRSSLLLLALCAALTASCAKSKDGGNQKDVKSEILASLNKGDNEGALVKIESALAQNPEDIELLYFKAQAYSSKSGIDVYSLFPVLRIKLFEVAMTEWQSYQRYKTMSESGTSNGISATGREEALNKRAFEFFQKHGEQKVSQFTYNPYESLISGMAAFVIGNVGYLTTESSSLKLTYSAIQTIGIINIGQGIYQAQAPAVDNSLRGIFTDEKMKIFTRERLAGRLLRVFAQEDRAKRLSLFYGSSFLTIQYAMNATIYKSSGQLKKIYLFLGGVNAIVAIYSAFSKSQYEEAYYGNKLDISPFVSMDGREPSWGLLVDARF